MPPRQRTTEHMKIFFEKVCSLTIQCKNFTAILMKEEEIYVK